MRSYSSWHAHLRSSQSPPCLPLLGRVVAAIVFASVVKSASASPPVTAIAIHPTQGQAVVGSQAGVVVVHDDASEPIPAQIRHVHDLRLTPDGKLLLVAGGRPGQQGTVALWDWADRKQLYRSSDHHDLAYQVAWRDDQTSWASASWDGTCRVYQTASGTCQTTYTGHSRAVLALQYLPGSQQIVSAGVDRTIRVWDSVTGEHIRTLANHRDTVYDLASRPTDGTPGNLTMLASASEDRTIRLWQPTIGRLVRFVRLPSAPHCLVWAPSGDRLWAGCHDGSLWGIDPETLVMTPLEHRASSPIFAIAWDTHRQKLVVGDTKAGGTEGIVVYVSPK